DYLPEPQEPERDADGKKKRGRPPIHWRRASRGPLELDVALDEALESESGVPVADTGLRLVGHLDTPQHIEGLPAGTCALSLFLVTGRQPSSDPHLRDAQYAFQVCLELRHDGGLVARPNLAGLAASDWDDQVMDLQFRDAQSYASGHGITIVPI